MKTRKLLILTSLLSFGTFAYADKPTLGITKNQVWFSHSHTLNYYQIESSPDLSTWTNFTVPFVATATPSVFTYDFSLAKHKFFRGKGLISADNSTYSTYCEEEDNVNVPLRGDINSFSIIAEQPTEYTVIDYNSPTNFTNCNITGGNDYSFSPLTAIAMDDHVDVMKVVRLNAFWRPYGMNITLNGGSLYPNMHYVVFQRKIPDQSSWPEFFVLYCDGNMRLIPFPPSAGVDHIQYGTSVIVGPADPAIRPMAEISKIDYRSTMRTLYVEYRYGGSAILDLNEVTRQKAVVKVAVSYPTDVPFCTIRSMWVSDGMSDVDRVWWKSLSGIVRDDRIMDFAGGVGAEWLFHRNVISNHNQSSPKIRISFQ